MQRRAAGRIEHPRLAKGICGFHPIAVHISSSNNRCYERTGHPALAEEGPTARAKRVLFLWRNLKMSLIPSFYGRRVPFYIWLPIVLACAAVGFVASTLRPIRGRSCS